MSNVYWTVRHKGNGYPWKRLWPNEKQAWEQLRKETGMTKKQINLLTDWTLVQVRLIEVKAKR